VAAKVKFTSISPPLPQDGIFPMKIVDYINRLDDNRQDQINTSFDIVLSAINKLDSKVDAKFDKSDAKVAAQFDKSDAKVAAQFKDVTAQFKDVAAQFDKFDSKFAMQSKDIAAEFDKFDSKVKSVDDKITFSFLKIGGIFAASVTALIAGGAALFKLTGFELSLVNSHRRPASAAVASDVSAK
jgi:hypothetical protein